MQYKTLSAHPAAELFPLLDGEAFESFKKDIAENGLLEPIWLYDEQILDGRNRYRACTELGIEPQFRQYTGASPLSFVWSINVERRHLTKSQHAAIGVEMLPLFQEEAKKRMLAGVPDPTRNSEEGSQTGEAAAQVAAIVGVDRSMIYEAKAVKESDPTLFEEVKNGTVSVRGARQKIRGAVKPPPTKNDRIDSIRSLAADGHLASQIAEKIGLTPNTVREYANESGITLADRHVGKVHRIDARRVIESTVQGLDGTRIALETVWGSDWGLHKEEAAELHGALAKSFKALNRLSKELRGIANGN